MKYREIGSEFWDIPTGDENHLFNNSTSYFISGRAALDYILRDIKSYRNVKTAAMPSWCCDTMIAPFIRNGIDVIFYPVTINDKRIVKDLSNIKADILLNIDYFGYEVSDEVNFAGIVITDVSHSIFVKEDKNSDYTFGSLRKWAGFKTGGFAASRDGFKIKAPEETNQEYIDKRSLAMSLKQKYIKGETDDKGYLNVYGEAEDSLEFLYDLKGYDEDIKAIKHLDIEYLKNKRRENAQVLIDELKDYCLFDLKDNDCPLFVPIIIDDRNGLRKHLIEHNVYCPVHWPISDLHKLTEEEKYIYDHELSLICDQRYDVEDMKEVLSLIRQYLEVK